MVFDGAQTASDGETAFDDAAQTALTNETQKASYDGTWTPFAQTDDARHPQMDVDRPC